MERKKTACDVDVSAFLLGANQKVLGDSWFVFYGQPQSPDRSVSFETLSTNQCEKIHIQLKSVKFRCAKNRICINYKRSTYKKFKFQYD